MVHKRKSHPRRFHLGSRTRSPVPNNPGRILNRTGQHQNQRLNPVIHRVLLTKTQNLPQPRRFPLGQTNGRRITRRILEKVDRNRKRMQFQHNFSPRTTDIQIYDGNHRQKTTVETNERKNIRTIELIKQNTYEKKNKKNTIHEALISIKEKQAIKEEPIQTMERFGARSKTRPTGNRPCRFCGGSNWTPLHKCPATETNCNKYGKSGHYAKLCRQRYTNNRTVKKLTVEEADDQDETSSESTESIHHIKEIKKIEEKNNTKRNSKINGKKERIPN